MSDIRINGIVVDPTAAGLALAAAQPKEDAATTNYVLVQTRGPLTAAKKQALAATGAQILEYAPEDTYLCRFDPSDLSTIRALPFVTWTGPYLKGFKVPTSLLPEPSPRLTLASARSGPPRAFSSTPHTVDIAFHADADPDETAKAVAAAAGVDPDLVSVADGKVRLTVGLDRLKDIADIDEVHHVEPVIGLKLHNTVARTLLRLDPATGPVVTLRGEGQVIVVADTGFDTGSTTAVHPAFTGRVRHLYSLGRQGRTNDPHGHGTHVAGSALGDGPARGTAPDASLVVQSLFDAGGGLGGVPANLGDLFGPPYRNDDARVHTNSWGSTLGDGRYDDQARAVDDFVWNHRDCAIRFAAGNEGEDRDGDGIVGAQSVTPPGTAKNCITVGACESLRAGITASYGSWWPQDFPAAPLAGDPMADNPDGIVGFSSRGPTQDGRIKPDLVAPGTFILSARSQATQNTAWGPGPDPLYMYSGGTSMATPLIAGCAALVREFLIKDRNIAQPSAALVKAMLINGARDLPGQYTPSEAGQIPNHAEGFGAVDMQATVGIGAQQIILLRDEDDALDTDEEFVATIDIAAAGAHLKVTLVWTDAPGSELRNDLDLIVQASGDERHGNVPPGNTGFDRVNNIEQIEWTDLPAGKVTITVRAHRVAIGLQTFALVARID